jgi:two-component system, LytTR family, response regulator
MIKCMIVDDEELAQKSLQLIILKYFNTQLQVVKIAASVKEAAAYLNVNTVDILFLDIDMPQENGFELINKLPNLNCSIIFTTAYEQYALKAIKTNALDYLLKPINIQELDNAITKHLKHKNEDNNINLDVLLKTINYGSNDKIAINTTTGFELIRCMDIVCMYAKGNNTQLSLSNGSIILSTKQLGILTKELSPLFCRIHKSHSVNLELIKQYDRHTGEVLMITNQILAVSISEKGKFLGIFRK